MALPGTGVGTITEGPDFLPKPVASPGSGSGGLLDYTQADDDVAGQVNKVASSDSPLMKTARQTGLEVANGRGLLNTSISAGASQREMLKAALPIGTQEAAQNFQKNRANQDYTQQYSLGDQQITGQKDLSKQGFEQSTALTTQQGGIASNLSAQEASQQQALAKLNIGAAAETQARDILAQAQRQALQIKSDDDRAKLQADTQTAIEGMQIDDVQKRQLLQIADQQLQQQRSITSTEGIAHEDAANKLAIQQLTSDVQQRVAQMNIAANAQDKAMAAATNAANIYASMMNNISANKDIPADARTALQQNAKNMFESQMGLVEQIYSTDLTWGDAGVPSQGSSSFGGATSDTTTGGTTSESTNGAQIISLQDAALIGRSPANPPNGYVWNSRFNEFVLVG